MKILFLSCLFFIFVSGESELPYPRFVILGPTGVGKSSLGNILAGCRPDDEDCFFPVCSGVDSCTKNTTIATGNYLGNGTNVTLVDTPGFGDAGDDQTTMITEMVGILADSLKEANVTILCFDYNSRFDTGVQKMILELESLFGRDRFWQNVIIEITKWSYSETAIALREAQGINETTAMNDINQHLQELFHLTFDLQGVFIDSYAVIFEDDETQQTYFQKYTSELMEFAKSKSAFEFVTIEDILANYQMIQSENDCLNGIINERLDSLEGDITALRIKLGRTIDDHQEDMKEIDSTVKEIVQEYDKNFEDIVSQQSQISISLQDHTNQITTLITDLNAYKLETTGVLDSIRAQVAIIDKTALRQCRVCFEITGPGVDYDYCGHHVSGCSSYSNWEDQYPDDSTISIDINDIRGGCYIEWSVQCVSTLVETGINQ